jgi:hypothetical protein
MSNADPYETWRTKRSDVEVDEQFADRVMEALRAPGLEGPGAVPPSPTVLRVVSRCAAAALVAASILIGLLRLESVAALVLLLSSEGF